MPNGDLQEDLSGVEWTLFSFLMGLVLVASWIISLMSWLASPNFWVEADKTVGTALVRGWSQLTTRANQLAESSLVIAVSYVLIAVLMVMFATMATIAFDQDVATWFWENMFSQPWWYWPTP